MNEPVKEDSVKELKFFGRLSLLQFMAIIAVIGVVLTVLIANYIDNI